MHALTKNTAHTVADVSDTLKHARVAAGLTQSEIAKQLDVSRSWISQFERGQTKGVALARILDIAEALGVTISLDYEGAEEQPQGAVLPPETISPKGAVFHVRSGLDLVHQRQTVADAAQVAQPVELPELVEA
ncbi:helix-turn-helix domain-containing protein [Corynebacterium halotolerans]|uniref:HTH cro/C1-type domain-containing protein n=1 Tax=Corynebacterium halotolerans YIM 70093 = DSM 44683 TaxID=1121362 RepID=M1NUD0_9CORY|nr:helix-turn-helix transcriptional regulator [Corynebacterium halotolerans]AGF71115.1 hypothetical protein A605_00495 [Corynebacterium halotolerans YIM 70093 = DSM 44683]